MMLLVDVALPVPLARIFTYEVPSELVARATTGARVVCPFGTRRLIGVVLGAREGEPPDGVKRLHSVLDTMPAVPADLVLFLRDLASYYMAPIGEVMRLALPPLEKEDSRALAEPTLFDSGMRGVATRTVQWVVATDAPDLGANEGSADAPRGQAAAILAHVRATGDVPTARLAALWGNARPAIKKLASHNLVRIEEREAPRDPFFANAVPRDTPPVLTDAQRAAVDAIDAALVAREAKTFLLHGVTGSGKTEVYLHAIAVARAQERGVLVLVPEIALTPQLVARFRARFGDEVAVVHSGLTVKERLVMWQRIHRAEVDVVIGARSALFAPLKNIGLVIVDEEHDSSFKQEEGVRYHARDMAIFRAHRCGAVCVLGTATPSLETEHLARTGKATKLRLPGRARTQAMPRVSIVDLRRIGPGPTGDKRISLHLHRAIEDTLKAKEQAILFLNRRGFAPSVQCQGCGVIASCPSCSVALTFHKRAGAVVRCHYCEYERPMPTQCKACGSAELALEGLGTEKLEETLAKAFPEARIARLDRDVATGKTVEKVLDRVRAREVDILVGTQMVTKGHDLPFVTLVGVINADAATSIPDFRAAERAFQLLVQVAGRAGRGDLAGRVLVQTYNPEHPAITFALRHDVPGFIEQELANRRELGYPPYARVALIRIDAVDENEARDAAQRVAEAARAASAPSVAVLGPAPAPLARLRNRFRFRVMLRSADRAALRRVLVAADKARAGLPRDVRCILDIDPMQLL